MVLVRVRGRRRGREEEREGEGERNGREGEEEEERGDLREGDMSHYLLPKEHHPGNPEEEDVVTSLQ